MVDPDPTRPIVRRVTVTPSAPVVVQSDAPAVASRLKVTSVNNTTVWFIIEADNAPMMEHSLPVFLFPDGTRPGDIVILMAKRR